MKETKRILGLLLALALCFGGLSGTQSVFGLDGYTAYGDFLYYVENGGAVISSADISGNVEIPAEINGIPVTAIEDQGFQGTDLTKVKLPDSIVRIGRAAFHNCAQLQEVWAFRSVTDIGTAPFTNCPNLTIYAPTGSALLEYASINSIPNVPVNFLTFDRTSNGGDSANNTILVADGSSVNLAFYTASRASGWQFLGWSETENSRSVLSGNYTMPAKDQTLYAVYRKAFSPYITARFIQMYPIEVVDGVTNIRRANNGYSTGGITLYNNELFQPSWGVPDILAPVYNNKWAFHGWVKNSTLPYADVSETIVSGKPYYINDNVEFYATYKRQTPITVTYSAPGAQNPTTTTQQDIYVSAADYAQDQYAMTKPFALAEAPVRSGMLFDRWAKGSATGPLYNASSTVTVPGDTTFVATWVPTGTNAYQVTYDSTANGGTNANVTSRLTYAGTKIDMTPWAEKAGNIFWGWNRSQQAASGELDLIMPEANLTLYGVFRPAPQPAFQQNDRFSFANSRDSFGSANYPVLDSDFMKLGNYTKALYLRDFRQNPSKYNNSQTISQNAALSTINGMQRALDGSWGGSCYGFSLAAVLHKEGKINFTKHFDPAASTLWQVKKPKDSAAVMSALNYYWVSQLIGFTRSRTYQSANGSLEQGNRLLVENALAGKHMPFFALNHAINIFGIEQGPEGSINLLAYDNNYPGSTRVLNVSNDYKALTWEGTPVNHFEFASSDDLDARYAGIDIDGPSNDMVIDFDAVANPAIPLQSQSLSGAPPYNETAELRITGNGVINVANTEGQTLVYDCATGEATGTMAIYDSRFIVSGETMETETRQIVPATYIFVVPQSDSFRFTNTSQDGQMDAQVLSCGGYAAAASEKAKSIVISQSEGITVQGPGKIDFEAYLGVNNDIMDMVKLAGTADSKAVIEHKGDGVVLQAQGNTPIALAVFSNTVNKQTIQVENAYGNLLVTGDGSGETGGVTVLASSKKDGDFDIELLHKHDYAAVTTQPTCTKQGYTIYTCACEDSYVDNYASALGHSWGEWAVTTLAMEVTEGIETRVCKRDASHTESRPVGILPHVHDYVSVTTHPACTEQGYTTFTCAQDSVSYVGDEVPALGHDWGAWTVTTPATTEREGVETRVCKRDPSHTDIRPIPKLTQLAQKWWQKLPSWLQFTLRWLCFGWLWMK